MLNAYRPTKKSTIAKSITTVKIKYLIPFAIFLLLALVKKFNGGPVGLDSVGVAISEDARTIEEVYEPYLIKEGFIQRTSRGRKALDKTFSYLDMEKPDSDSQVKIF